MKKIKNSLTFIILLVLYLETVLQLLIFGKISDLILKILFATQIISLLKIITSLFSEKINKIFITVLTIIICTTYTIYFVYYKTFGAMLSLYSITKGIQVAQFQSSILNVITMNWYGILFFMLPIIVYIILNKKITYEKLSKKSLFIFISILILSYISSVTIINLDKTEEIYSNKNLYNSINNSEENLRSFGLLTSIRIDIQRQITGFKEKVIFEYEDQEGNIKILNSEDYNITDIDFDKLIENETDEEIKEIHQYLKTEEPTKKNEYTGMFEGKNLIAIVGESFSSLAIREDLTPTLYKLANNGFVFENFYTPLFPVSTADGQYLTDNGILPAENTWSIEKVGGKLYPYSYGNVLKKDGYKTFAYHNYLYDYYKRDVYFETLGYDTYLGWGNGLEERMSFEGKPASDYEMMKVTVDDYINEDKFVAYYITMSGHMNYDNTNSMVVKNWDKVKDLPYSEKSKGYLATQIEFDKAIEELVNSLEKAGKLDDTVIVISGDHYPYGLNDEEIKELLPHTDEEYLFGRFHMPLIIYNSSMEKTVVEKYGSSLDILPTVLNLFGAEYDSRLLMGKDILSDIESLVIFSERSFITENERYDNYAGVLKRDGIVVKDDEYVKKIKQKIYHKYRYSRLILENDYYRKLFDSLK